MFKRKVSCPNCSETIIRDWSKFIVSSDVIDDREMGEETEHTIECDEVICPTCETYFCVRGSIFEYPPEAFNHANLKAEVLQDNFSMSDLKSVNDIDMMKKKTDNCFSYADQYESFIAELTDYYISKSSGLERIACELEKWDAESQQIIATDLISEIKSSGVFGFSPVEILKLIHN